MSDKNFLVSIRPLDTSDTEAVSKGYLAQHNFHELTTGFEAGVNIKTAIDYVQRSIEERTHMRAYRYGIWIQPTVMIGVVELHKINWVHRRCEVGIQIWDSNFQSKGYGTMALNCIINLAFDRLNINRLSATITSDNIVSRNLFNSAGFIEEGQLKEYIYVNGRYLDAIIVRLLRSEKKR